MRIRRVRSGPVRRRAAMGAVCLLALGAAWAEGSEDIPVPDASPVFKTTPQGELRIHLFLPPGHAAGDKRPGVVFFFGGGWRKGHPEQFFPQCAYLASRGMVAASAEYRVEERHSTSPRECVRDGKSAVRWLQAHCGELGVDPRRIAAGGGSAGGHVAAATALLRGFEEEGEAETGEARAPGPGALLLFNPVLDNGPGGAAHERVKDYWQEFSPLHNVRPGAPPAILFLGTEDHVLPVATAERFRDAMESAGSRCELRLYSGLRHGFFNHDGGGNPLYYETLTACDRFLESIGYLEGEPTLRAPRRLRGANGPPHRGR